MGLNTMHVLCLEPFVAAVAMSCAKRVGLAACIASFAEALNDRVPSWSLRDLLGSSLARGPTDLPYSSHHKTTGDMIVTGICNVAASGSVPCIMKSLRIHG